MTRLRLLTALGLVAMTGVAAACGVGGSGKRVIVIGIDGMDHGLLEQFMGEGRLPNFSRLADEGSLSPLKTTMPPLSPVAWSTFITGLDPGGHGVFDFLLRDPATMEVVEPFYAIGPEGRSLNLGYRLVVATLDNDKFRPGVLYSVIVDGGLLT